MELKATVRNKTGKGVRILRRQGTIPAVAYGQGLTNLNPSLDEKEFLKIYEAAGHSSVVDLNVEGEKEPLKVLIADVQEEPIKNSIIHVDFHKIDLSQKVSAEISLKFTGASAAVKSGAAILLTLVDNLRVEALPLDLPREIIVNISQVENIGQGVTIKGLPIDHTKVRVLDHKEDDLVVKLDYAVQIEKEEEVKSVEEVEVLKEKKEGEEGAEGETGEEEGSEKSKSKEEPKEEKDEKKEKKDKERK